MKSRRLVLTVVDFVLVMVTAVLAGCGDGPTFPSELQGGVLATFQVEAEQFKLWVTNESTIQQILDLQAGTSTASIPNGPVLEGAGPAAYNGPYSWHLDAVETEMADATIELCDGLPSFVEENLDSWLVEVGQYCPWSAQLLSVEDYR